MRPLAVDDIILAEHPLAILPIKWVSTNVPPNGEFAAYDEWYQYAMNEREELLKLVLARMAPEKQAAYCMLANSHQRDGSGPLSGIVCTNGYTLGLDPWFDIVPDIAERDEYQTAMCGVCEMLSRINHRQDPEDAVRAWLSNKKLAKDHLIKDSLQMMQLLEDEGLEVNWRYKGHAAVLAMVCAATGQRKNYLQARKKVMALSMACVPGKGCWLMELLPEVPEHQEFWMKRLRSRRLL
ncbi:hypothetical protein EWM64_g5024 [Hericium alpestre]|uniref:Uncharacterized protein n=1 Tax=Hericium alpestre TaxID=135208 RepID=A0A4Y9ZVZ7_9AGAM|nr:hypothetical protein EWM64_g5024 [Hericium alpestre]